LRTDVDSRGRATGKECLVPSWKGWTVIQKGSRGAGAWSGGRVSFPLEERAEDKEEIWKKKLNRALRETFPGDAVDGVRTPAGKKEALGGNRHGVPHVAIGTSEKRRFAGERKEGTMDPSARKTEKEGLQDRAGLSRTTF